LLFTHVLEES